MREEAKTADTARAIMWTRGVSGLIGMLVVIFAAALLGGPM